MNFNINNNIKVKLTEHGKNILKKQHEELYQYSCASNYRQYVPITEDENGFSTWQMWSLFETFKEHIHLSAYPLPFETEIIIPAEGNT